MNFRGFLIVSLSTFCFLLSFGVEAAVSVCQLVDSAVSPVAGVVQSQDKDDAKSANKKTEKKKRKGLVQRRLERVNRMLSEKYEPTGKEEVCIRGRSIIDGSALDDDSILFELRGGKAVVARMSATCRHLAVEDRFIYNRPNTSLCTGQIITVVDVFGRPFNSCSIGSFEKYKKKKKAKKKPAE